VQACGERRTFQKADQPKPGRPPGDRFTVPPIVPSKLVEAFQQFGATEVEEAVLIGADLVEVDGGVAGGDEPGDRCEMRLRVWPTGHPLSDQVQRAVRRPLFWIALIIVIAVTVGVLIAVYSGGGGSGGGGY
jgi:hypothetical protein